MFKAYCGLALQEAKEIAFWAVLTFQVVCTVGITILLAAHFAGY